MRRERDAEVRREVVGRRVAPGAPLLADFSYCVIETTPERPRDERRIDRRISSHLREAHLRESPVREPRGRPIADCRIRDFSRRGARLQLDRERRLPRTFMLREAGSGRAFQATLIWQAGRDAGVRLTAIDV